MWLDGNRRPERVFGFPRRRTPRRLEPVADAHPDESPAADLLSRLDALDRELANLQERTARLESRLGVRADRAAHEAA
jgi:hypothetical protein